MADLSKLGGATRPARNVELFKTTTIDTISFRVSHFAPLIRAICKKPPTIEPGRGFQNRGLHQSRRVGSYGEFEGVKVLSARDGGIPLGGFRVNTRATGRLSSDTDVAVNTYRLEEARNVMIVLDPASVDPFLKNNIALIAGIIAQNALTQRDRVGLVVGDTKVFIKPSSDRSQLEKILEQVLSFKDLPLARGSLRPSLSMLDNSFLRKNLPQGSQIIFISNFAVADSDGLKRVSDRFRHQSIEFVPIKTGDSKRSSEIPVIQIGKYKYKVHPKVAEVHHRSPSDGVAGYSSGINSFVASHGRVVDCSSESNPEEAAKDIYRQVAYGECRSKKAASLEKVYLRKSEFQLDVQDVFNKIAEIKNLDERIDGLKCLLNLAKLLGWEEVFDFLNQKLERGLSLGASAFGIKDDEVEYLARTRNELAGKEEEYVFPSEEWMRNYLKDENGDIHVNHKTIYKFLKEPNAPLFLSILGASGMISSTDCLTVISSLINDLEYITSMEIGRDVHRAPSAVPFEPRLLLLGTAAGPSNSALEKLAIVLPKVLEHGDKVEEEIPSSKSMKPIAKLATDPITLRRKMGSSYLWFVIMALSTFFGARFLSSETRSITVGNTNSINSGAGDKEGLANAKTLITFDSQPEGDHKYLVSNIGAQFNPNTCGLSSISEITRETLAPSIGEALITGAIADGVAVHDVPWIVGGERPDLSGASITYRITNSDIPEVGRQKLSDFKKGALKLYDGELYTTLTTPPVTMEWVREHDPKIADSWTNLIASVQNLPVVDAAESIRRGVLDSKRFSYHYYESWQERSSLFYLRTLSAATLCGGDGYLEMIFGNSGGVCTEMAMVGLTVERLAGIPTVVERGFMMKDKKISTATAHTWATMVLPNGDGKYYAHPLEFAETAFDFMEETKEVEPILSGESVEKIVFGIKGLALLLAFATVFPYARKAFNIVGGKVKEEVVPIAKSIKRSAVKYLGTTSMKYKSIMNQLEDVWVSNSDKKREMSYWLELLLSSIELRNTPFGGRNAADLILAEAEAGRDDDRAKQCDVAQITLESETLPGARLLKEIFEKADYGEREKILAITNRWLKIWEMKLG